MGKKPANAPKKPPGFPPERLKLHGDWEQNVAHAIKAKKPEGGWPKPTRKQKQG